jgi:hypothetical protein
MARRELLIAKLPDRSGLYLGYEDADGVWNSVARFTRGAESAKVLVDWAKQAGIRYEEGGTDGEAERPGPVV